VRSQPDGVAAADTGAESRHRHHYHHHHHRRRRRRRRRRCRRLDAVVIAQPTLKNSTIAEKKLVYIK